MALMYSFRVLNSVQQACSNIAQEDQSPKNRELDNDINVAFRKCSCEKYSRNFNCSIICQERPKYSTVTSSQGLRKQENRYTINRDKYPSSQVDLPSLLVVIFSRPSSFLLRQSCRKTWLNGSQKGVVHRFVIGLSGLESELLKDIQKESKDYTDLLLLDQHKEAYGPHCTDKLLLTLYWASRHSTARYLMKTDDDCYVRLDYIIHILETRSKISHKPFLCGTIVQHALPGSTGKWAEHGWHQTKEYLPFSLGSGHVLPLSLVKTIVNSNDLVPLRKLNNEDVTLGLWLAQYNIDYVHIQRYSHKLISEKEEGSVCPSDAENITIFHCSQSHELMYKAHNCFKTIQIGCFCNVRVR